MSMPGVVFQRLLSLVSSSQSALLTSLSSSGAGHKAKNFSIKESQSTKVATCVLELQRMLPRARVVYCSATGE